ncbi:MAG: hypothetical protein JWO30_346 [Fibrobacteres bacterium]|nr:hypothetical protein [Fibrobacterota bacterium]
MSDPTRAGRADDRRFRSRLAAFGLLSALIVFGCTQNRIRPLTGPAPTVPYRSVEAHGDHWLHGDSLWALRSDPAAAHRSLKEYRKAVKNQKTVPELFARLSHACYFAASLEPSIEKRNELFREGQDAAENGMLLHPGYRNVVRETGDEIEAAQALDSSFMEILYWYTINLGRELNAESVIIRRGNKARLESLNEPMLRLDPACYYAGPHRIAGAIPARLPEGDLRVSKAHFDTAVAMAPLYLTNRVAYAEFYAIRAKDKQTFRTQLGLAVSANADTLPEIAPENHLAQARAKALLAKVDTLFP